MLSLRVLRNPAMPEPAAAALPVPVPEPGPGPGPVARLVHPVPVPAPRARRRRWLRWVPFVLIVVVPVAVAAAYLFAVATDQYVSEFRFTLRTVAPPPVLPGWPVVAGGGSSRAAADSRILVQYVASRAIVDDLGRTLDLRRIYSPPTADWWARLHRPAPIERLVAYWRGQTQAYYDAADATVVVRVRAFSPADALAVARAVSDACGGLVNGLSRQMRRDALRQAEEEVAAAKARLAAVLAAIGDFREREGLIDPAKTASAGAALAARLQGEVVRADTRLATLRAYMRDDSPAVAVVKARIRSLEAQRRALARTVTAPDPAAGDTLPHAIGAFEALENRQRFAADAYRHALADLDRARADADRQQVYIAAFVPPSLAQDALYPRRWRTLGVVTLIAFAAWAIGGLMLQSIRDHI